MQPLRTHKQTFWVLWKSDETLIDQPALNGLYEVSKPLVF